jgi:ribosome-binding factor A
MTFKRADRVADAIVGEISDILLKEARDPRISHLTITGVKMSDDLRLARIFFVQMGKDEVDKDTWEGLEKAKGFLKRELGKRLQLRYVPDITFLYDKSFEYGSHIDRLLMEIHQKGETDAE